MLRERPVNELTRNERISDVQASVDSAIERRAWLVQAGLGRGVVLDVECKRDDVSHIGGLKRGRLSA